MGLWFYEDDPPFAFSLADQQTELVCTLILRGAWDADEEREPCEVVDFAAVKAARAAL